MNNEVKELYIAPRGIPFTDMIKSVLKRSGLKKKYRNILLTEESLAKFAKAFTSAEADPENNYEMYELMGDVSAGHFIKWYMIRRFPVLKCAKGVKVVARLLINYGSKQTFYKFGERLGFWEYISASVEERARERKSLLEDVFEAFLGVIEETLDEAFATGDDNAMVMPGVGYSAVYAILKSIFDEMDISLKFEDLYDAKTRLKEVFDKHKDRIGTLLYEEDPRVEGDQLTTSRCYRVFQCKRIVLGTGTASLKPDAQQRAAAVAIEVVAKLGYRKEAPPEYKLFAHGAN